MAIQLVVGGSGSGKSQYIYSQIIQKSIKYPEKNFIVVVPEQYTMATQKKLVESHPRKGILNIDVVSFDRLAYKVFEEIGGQNKPVLDDTGKNLIVRKVLEDNKGKLCCFGSTINKVGFVSELKSVISELLQYDIDTKKLDEISCSVGGNRLLKAKLEDISLIYSAFKKYLSDNYITSEEILAVLCQVVGSSENIKRSEIVLDGFTGFTPIQYKLLNLLLIYSEGVTVSVTMDARERLNVNEGMEHLFFMSKEMVQKLYGLCDLSHIDIQKPVVLDAVSNPRFKSEELSFLEKNIFRFNGKRYKGEAENIKLITAQTPKEELKYCIGEILRLTRFEGYRYRDIAVVSADMSSYGLLAGNMCRQNGIPCFVDSKKPVTDNPFVEYVRSALEVIERGYSYESVFRYLRSGMTGLEREDIDLLDNYCVAAGIRGSRAWHGEWTKKGRGRNAYPLEHLNSLREIIVEPLSLLESSLKMSGACVEDYVRALYRFIKDTDCAAKIKKFSEMPEAGREYEQLYGKVIDFLDKLVELLGGEKVSVSEFNRIVDSGFAEIKVGLIPPTSDCVVIGDIERTRLDDIKVMFFVGVNDGLIPKKNENTSVLSEADRETLEQIDVTLSPGARRKSFVQRFYLYLILTKASERLYVTCSSKGSDGKSLLPSYLIRNLRQIFPKLSLRSASEFGAQMSFIRIPKTDIEYSEENYIRALGENMALKLFGSELTGSVSAFETFASCQFAYFLKYGLGLEERERYTFEVADFGTVLHRVLESVCSSLKRDGRSVGSLEAEERRRLVSDALESISSEYADTVLKDSGRNEFLIKRMADLADRTLWAVGKQLDSGIFSPDVFEMPFIMDEQEIPLGKASGRMVIRGKIDRIDICEDEENLYVRIIDYKSGRSDFDLLKAYYGIKMQLVMYMRAAVQIEKKRHPGKRIIPSGLLYYNIDNPVVEDEGEDVSVEDRLLEALRMQGVVNSDGNIIKDMDGTDIKKSLVIPVSFKKDGTPDSRSHVLKTEQFEELQEYISGKSLRMGKEIFSGANAVNPYKDGSYSSCTYCPYSEVCGFSQDLGNHSFRRIKKLDDEQIWKNIAEGVDENGSKLDR